MGLSAEVTFFGQTLQRYHLQAQFEQREDYKTYPNSLTQRTFTPAHREEITSLMNGIYDNMVTNFAADRGITPQATRAAIEPTPFIAQRAQELHLIDQIGRPEEAERAALARAENADTCRLQRLSRADAFRRPHHRGRSGRRRDRLRPRTGATRRQTDSQGNDAGRMH